jgi:hypothetical protein
VLFPWKIEFLCHQTREKKHKTDDDNRINTIFKSVFHTTPHRILHLLCTFCHRKIPRTHYVPYLTLEIVLIRQCQTTIQKNCHCPTLYAEHRTPNTVRVRVFVGLFNAPCTSTVAVPIFSNFGSFLDPLRLVRSSTLRLRKFPIASIL